MSMIGSSEHAQDVSLTGEISYYLGKCRSQARAIKLKLHECQDPGHTVHTTVSSAFSTQQVVPPSSPGSDSVTVNEENSFTTTHSNPTQTQSTSITHSSPTTHSNPTTHTVSLSATVNQSISALQPMFTNPLLQVQQHLPSY